MSHHGRARTGKSRRAVRTVAAIIAAAAIAAGVILYNKSADHHDGPLPVNLPPASASYLGVFTKGLPSSYAGVTAFTNATGARPDVLMYYSGWYMPFPTGFANTAANNGAVPLVQMDPDKISIAAIAVREVRRLPERVRRGRPRLPPPGHPELRPRDERPLVLLGLYADLSGGIRGGLAAHRHAVPRAGSQERDLAVDGQHHQRHPARHDPAARTGGGPAART